MKRHVTWIFILALCVPSLSAQSSLQGKPWPRHVIDASSRGCDGVRFMDINGDGRLDCITGWEQGGVVRACLHPGRAKVRATWPSVTVGKVGAPEDAVFTDLDGDGAIDAVSACEGKTNAIYAHWSPRDRKQLLDPAAWQTEAFPAVKGMCQWMFCAPMQIDGQHGIDLVVGGKNKNGQIGWLQAPAQPRDLGAWKYHSLLPAGWIMSLVALDMNGDRQLDILVSDRRGKDSGCFWLENPGPGPEQTRPWRAHRIGPKGDEVMFLESADLDGDGLKDVLVPTFNRKLHFFRQRPPTSAGGVPGWEQRRIAYPVAAGSGKAIRVADVNGDGKLDLVLASANAEKAHGVVWMSYRSSPLDEEWDAHDISGLAGIKFDLNQLIDVDGDGDLDVVNTEESTAGRGLGVIWYENPTR